MVFYAEIDTDGKVTTVSQQPTKINKAEMIQIQEYDTTLLGKLYEAGKFIDMNYYAKLNPDSIVTHILSNPSNKPMPSNWGNTIPITQQDYSLIGTKYINGEFIKLDPQKQLLEELLHAVNNLANKVTNLENKVNNQ